MLRLKFVAKQTLDGAIIERFNEITGVYEEMPHEKYFSFDYARNRARELNEDCPPDSIG